MRERRQPGWLISENSEDIGEDDVGEDDVGAM